jgi:hypothetical protein
MKSSSSILAILRRSLCAWCINLRKCDRDAGWTGDWNLGKKSDGRSSAGIGKEGLATSRLEDGIELEGGTKHGTDTQRKQNGFRGDRLHSLLRRDG